MQTVLHSDEDDRQVPGNVFLYLVLRYSTNVVYQRIGGTSRPSAGNPCPCLQLVLSPYIYTYIITWLSGTYLDNIDTFDTRRMDSGYSIPACIALNLSELNNTM
eukprot:SAG31_NODE_1598_length_7798_cov_7.682167_9_plen_104_part_00